MYNFQKNFITRLSIASVLLCSLIISLSERTASAQQKVKKDAAAATAAQAAPPALKRTTSRREVRRFAYGSSLTIVGAPMGSITIEAWPRSEVEVSAEVELQANSEEELALLATVNNFVIDEDANHLRILTTGTHDRAFMRRNAKKFPKTLMNLPWKIDYRIRVPAMCDLEIDAGRGAFNLSGVEGLISLKALESNATLNLTGGAVLATVGAGSVQVNLMTRSWRGSGAIIQLAVGDLTVELPSGFNADIEADVLRSGQVENSYEQLVPQERTAFTQRSLRARAGSGGATLSFKVTDGTLRIKKQ
jgi:hypothetical protein